MAMISRSLSATRLVGIAPVWVASSTIAGTQAVRRRKGCVQRRDRRRRAGPAPRVLTAMRSKYTLENGRANRYLRQLGKRGRAALIAWWRRPVTRRR